MRALTQLAMIVVLGGAGATAWTYREPLTALWSAPPATAAGPQAGQQGGSRTVPVVAKPVRVGRVIETVEAVGSTLANESIVVTSKLPGIVREIRFEEGQAVRAGQVLVQLDDRETLAELEQARAARESARQTLARTRQLLEQRAAPQARVDELEQTFRGAEARVKAVEARFQDLSITAPFPGRVGLRRVSVGALVQPTTQITTLDDTSVVKLRFSVPETALAALQVGAEVDARSGAYPGRRFTGRLSVVDTRVDPVSRSVEARAELPNADGALKPGMFLSVQLVTAERPQALLVPEEALVPEGTRQFVFVVKDGRAVRTEVKLGARIPGEAEILEGLAPNAVVVTGGVQRIRDGAAVRPIDAPTS